jgi:solute carrier family 8 (sodium/calcium exchanger)
MNLAKYLALNPIAEDHYMLKVLPNGFVEEYWEKQRCNSGIIIPGTSLMNKGLTGFIYLMWLLWLFVGISIVSDIFMESIEAITSQTQIIVVKDPETGEE